MSYLMLKLTTFFMIMWLNIYIAYLIANYLSMIKNLEQMTYFVL